MNTERPENRRPETTPSSGTWQALFPHEPPPVPDHAMLRCIGRGAFGEVWLARTVMGTYRAVKVVYRDAFEHERPFEREFEGIQRFEPVSREHPSQIAILHVGRNEEAGCFYYVMELADDAGSRGRQSAQISPPSSPGTTLAPTDVVGYGGIDPDTYLPRTLKYEQHQRGRLPVDEVLRLGTSLATALDHLHRHGLVHRDIKPSNIIFVNGVPKLADVGLVATVEASLSVAGTPGYMPPEGAGTPKGDLYSLGKVLYELATGKERQAFPALPRAVLESGEGELLRELSAVLDKACDGDPTRRYDSAAEMHADLAMIRGGRSVRRSRWLERRQKTLIRGFTTLLVAALVSTGGLLYWRETAQWANTTLENQRKTEIRLNEALGSSERASAEKEDALTRLRMAIYAGAMREAFYAAEGQRWPEVFRLLREQVPTNGGTDLRGWEWRYLEGVARQLRGKEMHHWSNGVFSIAVAPNQESIALGFGNGSIGIWTPDLQNNIADLGSLVGGDATVTFSPNGDHLYAVGSGGGFAAWQWRDDGWTCVTNIPLKFKGRHGSSPLVIQPDGKAAFLSDPGSARDDHKASPPRPDAVVSIARLDLTSFAMSTLPMNHMEDLYAVAVSPLGRWLASGGGDNRVHLLDLTQLEAEPTTAQLEASTADLCFVGEDRLVVADCLGFVRVLSLPELEEIVSRKSHENGVTAVAYDPNSGRLLSTGLDGSLRALDLEAANEGLPDVVGAVEGQAQALAVLPKGRGVLVADQAGGVMRFGSVVAAQGLRPEVMVDPWWGSHWGHASYGACLDANHLATLWDFNRAEAVVRVNLTDAEGHVPLPRQFDVGQQSGTRMVVGYDDGTIRLLECAGGTAREIKRLRLAEPTDYPFYYSRDERLVAFPVNNGQGVLVWDCSTTNTVRLEAGPGRQVTWLEFSADSREVIVKVRGGGRKRWHLDPGPPFRAEGPFALGLPDNGALEYARGGSIAYSADAGGSFIHRMEKWRVVESRQLPGLRTGSTLAVFTSDESRLILDAKGTDHIEIIDTETLDVVGRLPDPLSRGSAQLILSENGEHFYIGTRPTGGNASFVLHHYHVPALSDLEPEPKTPPQRPGGQE